MKHNEDSRVKIPALLHFTRLGYTYQSKINSKIDTRNNIFVDIFAASIRKINKKDYSDEVISSLLKEIATLTDNSVDKGETFYKRLFGYHAIKLIDTNRIENNDFRVVTELQFQGERKNFRPDITILINGIPLGYVEVKKPNNQKGIQAEFERMKERLKFEDCKHFFNQLQVLGFTNNQNYNDTERIRLQGSFYTTPNGKGTKFNLFREEQELYVKEYVDEGVLVNIFADTNSFAIRETEEFKSNLKVSTPCNRFLTSVFAKERLMFFIKYGLAYVHSQVDGLNKHIIRYPQYFAIQALIKRLSEGDLYKSIVWHTQGSGKTSLSYFLTNVLRDFFQKKKVITKFYFIVDRLDLLTQASTEFSSRGMTIAKIESKADFAANIKSSVIVGPETQQGTYKETMNCVNIQRFSEESTVNLKGSARIQRIYFIDEVHRSYRMSGEFLANLLGADPNGIFIGLTGTPLLKEDFKSTDIFDGYIHKYYYNKSILDGYTLKIKKENIATELRSDVRSLLGIAEDRPIPKSAWNNITSAPNFVEKLSEYIQKDFKLFREEVFEDPSLGFMVVAATSEQARLMQEWFETNSNLKTALVLYDEDDKKGKQEGFRGIKNAETGKIESIYDGVIVYSMLLTGFDAPRLKRLYLMRELKEHSLLQTLARVNRPYKNMPYGYVVDFVDITEQYEETNQRYLDELKEDIKDENDIADVAEFFVDVNRARNTIRAITTDRMFIYMHNIETNLEAFSTQIEHLDEEELRRIRTCLTEYREAYNELRMSHENVSGMPIARINNAFYEVNNRINLKIAERLLESDDDVDDIDFSGLVVEFLKTGEMDLEFDTGNDILEKVADIQNAFSSNADKKDKGYQELYNKFKGLIKKIKNEVRTVADVTKVLKELDFLQKEIILLNNRNTSLVGIYKGNESCMRIHKRLLLEFNTHFNEGAIYGIMIEIMLIITDTLCHLSNPTEAVVKRELARPIRDAFKTAGYKLSPTQVESIIYLFLDDMFTQE